MSFRQTVLQEGMNVFKKHGIRELTMEAILSQLDISRGTMAEIARSKTELLEQCIEQTLAERKIQFAAIMARQDQPPATILELLKVHLETLAGSHPAFFMDLKSFHLPCWNQIEAFSENILKVNLNRLLQQGMEDGLFQPGLNPALVSRLMLAQAHAIADTDILNKSQYNFDLVFQTSFMAYLRGLCTASGLALLDAKAENSYLLTN